MPPKGDPRGGRPLKDPAGPSKMISFRLSPSTIEAIKAAAKRLQVSQSDLLTQAVDAYLTDPP